MIHATARGIASSPEDDQPVEEVVDDRDRGAHGAYALASLHRIRGRKPGAATSWPRGYR
jgi:hypothetical protein